MASVGETEKRCRILVAWLLGADRFGDRFTLGDNIKTDPMEIEFEVASWLKIRSNRVCCNTVKCLS